MTSTELVPVHDRAEIEALDPAAREIAVTRLLSEARNQLALAVQMTGPEAISEVKAQAAMAATATKQLGMSKEIQADAQEMVRRCEYALGKAIRAGQEAGEIRRQGEITQSFDRWNGEVHQTENSTKDSPYDFASKAELTGKTGTDGIYALAEADHPEFEAALTDAKAEGNLSRANVVRKIKGIKADGLTPVEKLTRLRQLAPTGTTASAIARELGVTETYVRDRAREHGIEIVAEKVTRNTRRLDANRVIGSIVIEAAALVSPSLLAQVDFGDLDREQLGEWISSLSESEKALRSLRRDLEKELHPHV